MKQYDVFICGNFGYSNNQLDGQTVKTRLLKDELSNALGPQNVVYSDTSQWKKEPFLLYKEVKENFKNSRCIIVLLAQKGIRLLLPSFVRWKKKYGKSLRYVVIGGWLPDYAKRDWILASSLKNLDVLYVETQSMKEELNKLGITRVSVLPNFRRFEKMNPGSKHIKLPLRAVILSRIMKEKGIHTAVEAVHSINNRAEEPCITLDIYGQVSKKYAEEFQALLRNKGNIAYKGYLEAENIQKTLLQYDIMLFPTYYHGEGMPGTIIDAYAAGLPVVASDWKYNSQLVNSGETGILFAPQSTEDLVKKLDGLMSDLQLIERMHGNCLQKAAEYHADKVLEELKQTLYSYMSANERRPPD